MSGGQDDGPLIDARLLGLLLEQAQPMTVHALSRALGLSVAKVQAGLGQLREAGCMFDEHPQHGLRLMRAGLSTWRDYLEYVTPGRSRVQVYQQTTSTQDVARQMVEAQGRQAHGAVVAADVQTAGRGRLGRRWLAPAGRAVTFSRVEFGGEGEGSMVERLTFATTVAVARALDGFVAAVGQRCRIKWPNDIYVGERKLAGILVESLRGRGKVRAAIIGVGVNVLLDERDLPADEDLRGRVTSLAILGAEAKRLAVLAKVVQALNAALAEGDFVGLLAEWRQRCSMLHQQVRLRAAGREVVGTVVDLDAQEGLIVRTATGQLVHLPAATTTVL